jgi:uncharacterized membrane protein YkvA (DUF1232 family)
MTHDEEYTRQNFWSKLRSLHRYVLFLRQALAVYFCATDPETPIHAKGVAFAALAYFIFPLDAIPDTIPVIGYVDDATVITTTFVSLAAYLKSEHYRRADAVLGEF